MTYREAYVRGRAELTGAGVPDADNDAFLLLEHVTGVGKTGYYADPDAVLSKEHAEAYFSLIKRRAKRVPLQHLTGSWDFMGFNFAVDSRALVPRQDTEILAEHALDIIKRRISVQDSLSRQMSATVDTGRQTDAPAGTGDGIFPKILDIGTGTGCVLISLMKLGNIKDATGTDISDDALEVAAENCRRLGVSPRLIKSDVFENVSGRYDLIVSNPPYIPTGEIENLDDEVRLYDPVIALDGGRDGLYFYRRIVGEAPRYLTDGGSLCLEIGVNEAGAVTEMMSATGFTGVTVIKDMRGIDRVVSGSYNRRLNPRVGE